VYDVQLLLKACRLRLQVQYVLSLLPAPQHKLNGPELLTQLTAELLAVLCRGQHGGC
jgi:hypothetical protein